MSASRYVAFLRAINTINRRVKNAELVAAVEDAGAEAAFGFLASGNVVFDWPVSKGLPETSLLEGALYERLRYQVPVMLRSAGEVKQVVAALPFEPESVSSSNGPVFVGFLQHTPTGPQVEAALAMETPVDRLAVVGREVYWLPTAGELDSELKVGKVEVALGTMTLRSFNTVVRIVDKFLVTAP